MSRTRRCKNELPRVGRWYVTWCSIAGYYTEIDRDLNEYGSICYVYREPTERERFYKEQFLHGESRSRNARSPGRYYRKGKQNQNERINKRELHKWIKNNEYEPLFEPNPRSCWMDWV